MKKKQTFKPSNEVVKMPLSLMKIGAVNVRKVDRQLIDRMAQSIHEVGLKQNLVVIPPVEDEAEFEIVAGSRRYLAMSLLVEQGRMSADAPIDVRIEEREAGVTTSLTENFQREPMHVIDEFKAFKALEDENFSPLEISLKFGIDEKVVRQRLALGSASPKLLEECLTGQMEVGQLMVLCQLESHELQETVWFNTPEGYQRNVGHLKAQINNDKVAVNDKLVKFVTLQAYIDAGGSTEGDLFSDDESDTYITDKELLLKLVNESLNAVSKDYLADGWKWTEFALEVDHYYSDGMGAIEKTARDMTEAELKQDEAWTNKIDQLMQDSLDAEEDGDFQKQEAIDDERDALITTQEEFHESLESYAEDDKASAGVYFAINRQGELSIETGLVKAEDVAVDETDTPVVEDASLSGSLQLTLANVRASAMQVEVFNNPRTAMVLLCHTLAVQTFFKKHSSSPMFSIELSTHTGDLYRYIDGFSDTVAGQAIEAENLKWVEKLPSKEGELLAELLTYSTEDLQALMAFCTSASLRLNWAQSDANNRFNVLAKLLDADVRKYWKPTATTFYGRLKKGMIIETIKDAGIDASSLNEDDKKGVMASKAEALLSAQNPEWRPELLTPQEIVTAEAVTDAEAVEEVEAVAEAEATSDPAAEAA